VLENGDVRATMPREMEKVLGNQAGLPAIMMSQSIHAVFIFACKS